MIREERELLTELAQLNRDMTPLCMRIMDRSASVAEQQAYAERLIAAGERLQRRITIETADVVIDGEVVTNNSLSVLRNAVQSHWNDVDD
ncbi:MAG: hypothetical protein ACRDSH_00500 [Pseudonocardiaceae bacterium]